MLKYFFDKIPAIQLTHITPPTKIMKITNKNHRAITIKYNVPYFHVSSSSYLYICTSEWIYRIHSEIRLKFPGWVFSLTFHVLRPRCGHFHNYTPFYAHLPSPQTEKLISINQISNSNLKNSLSILKTFHIISPIA